MIGFVALAVLLLHFVSTIKGDTLTNDSNTLQRVIAQLGAFVNFPLSCGVDFVFHRLWNVL